MPRGAENGQCRGSAPRLNLTKTIRSYQHQATAISARSNNSIVAVSNISLPGMTNITDVQSLQIAMGWLLNYTAAKLPVESSHISFRITAPA